MEHLKIDGIESRVPRVGLGTWAIGGFLWGGADDARSLRTIRKAFDLGINLVDTAPAYGFGRSEEIVGRAIAEYGRRDEIILVTKVALEWTRDKRITRNASRERILKEIDDSLRRLKTDYIDIYLIHWPDPLTPAEETAAALNELLDQGKIRNAGVSNYSPEQMEELRRHVPITADEPPYNLFEREIEKEVMPYCRENGIMLLTYGTICRGLLSGRMTAETRFEGDDLRKTDPKFKEPRYGRYLKAVARLDRFARDNFNKRVIHLAARWIIDRGVETALWGARRPEQLDAIEGVMGWHLSDSDRAEIDRILDETIMDLVGPQFMAPPPRKRQ